MNAPTSPPWVGAGSREEQAPVSRCWLGFLASGLARTEHHIKYDRRYRDQRDEFQDESVLHAPQPTGRRHVPTLRHLCGLFLGGPAEVGARGRSRLSPR